MTIAGLQKKVITKMMTDNEWNEVYDKGFRSGFACALSSVRDDTKGLGREIDGSQYKYISENMLNSVLDELKKKVTDEEEPNN